MELVNVRVFPRVPQFFVPHFPALPPLSSSFSPRPASFCLFSTSRKFFFPVGYRDPDMAYNPQPRFDLPCLERSPPVSRVHPPTFTSPVLISMGGLEKTTEPFPGTLPLLELDFLFFPSLSFSSFCFLFCRGLNLFRTLGFSRLVLPYTNSPLFLFLSFCPSSFPGSGNSELVFQSCLPILNGSPPFMICWLTPFPLPDFFFLFFFPFEDRSLPFRGSIYSHF